MRNLRRRRRLSPEIEDAIRGFVLEKHMGPTQIWKALATLFRDREPPSRRTIQGRVRELLPPDPSETWRLREADDDAELVLSVLHAVIERTEGRCSHFTLAEAEIISQIHRAAPDLSPWDVYEQARLYLAADAREDGEAIKGLEAHLAYAPWRSPEHSDRWGRAQRLGWVPGPRQIVAFDSGEGSESVNVIEPGTGPGTPSLGGPVRPRTKRGRGRGRTASAKESKPGDAKGR